ncbi:MAG TPA: hypothetical protein VGS08_03325 [Candidatus Saccharimonadales bacterium]|nr:hypothetical protein [Candidatus Saccharimonadales bacterium]
MTEIIGDALVDMDGVIADAHEGFRREMIDRYPDVHAQYDVGDSYFPLEAYAPEDQEAALEVLRSEDFFANLAPMEGMLEGWQQLVSIGLNPRICSAPFPPSANCIEQKIAWLEREIVPTFGRRVVDRALFTAHKDECSGSILIDDNPKLGTVRAMWRWVVYDHMYNRDAPMPRIMGWRDPLLQPIVSGVALASRDFSHSRPGQKGTTSACGESYRIVGQLG